LRKICDIRVRQIHFICQESADNIDLSYKEECLNGSRKNFKSFI